MDPLSQTIALVRPRGLLWKQLEARGNWGVRFPPNGGVVFSLVTSGRCIFQMNGQEASLLSEGDFLILAQPAEWSLGRDIDSVPVAYDHARVETGGRTNSLGDKATQGPMTQGLGGRF